MIVPPFFFSISGYTQRWFSSSLIGLVTHGSRPSHMHIYLQNDAAWLKLGFGRCSRELTWHRPSSQMVHPALTWIYRRGLWTRRNKVDGTYDTCSHNRPQINKEKSHAGGRLAHRPPRGEKDRYRTSAVGEEEKVGYFLLVQSNKRCVLARISRFHEIASLLRYMLIQYY